MTGTSTAATRPARSLRSRLTLLAAVLMLLLAAGSVGTTVVIRRWTHAVEVRRQARIATDASNRLRLAQDSEEDALRRYLSSGDAASLESYRRAVGDEADRMSALATHADGDPSLAAALAAVDATSARWRVEVAEAAVAARAAGDGAASEVDPDDTRERALDVVDRLLDDRLATAEGRVDRAQRRATGTLLACAALVAACTLAVLVLFRRWIERPVAAIAEAARAIGRGEQRPMPTSAITELDELAGAVDFLQESLSAARDRAVRAYEALEQSAVLALQVRAELSNEQVIAPDGWATASVLRPAEGLVAGDCFDIGLVDASTMYLVMIDVTGHGAVAALHALQAKSQLRAAVKSGLPPGRALGWLSYHHHDDRTHDLLTAFVATVDLQDGACRFANAGHPPALLVDGGSVTELGRTGPIVGAFPAATWTTETMVLPPGATLVLHTDGVTEACGAGRARYGEPRLREQVASAFDAPVGTLVNDIVRDVDAFRVGPLTDDITIVALRRVRPAHPVRAVEHKEALYG